MIFRREGVETMKRLSACIFAGLLLLAESAGANQAQAKRIKMKIDGYLCGN